MTTYHPLFLLRAGNSWVIPGQVTSDGVTPIVLDGSVTLDFIIEDANELPVCTTADVSIVVTDSALGLFEVHVPKEKTETLVAAKYTDYLDVTIAGNRDTYWLGKIRVLQPVQ